MKKIRVLTGDRPTGRLHLGHFVGSLQNRLKLQNRSDIDSRMYMVADVQALTDNYANPSKVRENVLQVAIDNMSIGLDPSKTTMFIQSMVPEIAELTVFFLNLVTVNRLMENPTVKSEIVEKGWNDAKIQNLIEVTPTPRLIGGQAGLPLQRGGSQRGVPAGFLCYPVSQAADILFARANLIPVGDDQRPMIEQTNEIAATFNRIYGVDLFPHVDILVGETPRLVGIDGNAKMSKSLGNVIYLSSTRDEIASQVRAAFTCPSKIRVEDTVSEEELLGNVVFQYLDVFDTNIEFVSDLKLRYKTGKTGDSEGKARLVEVLDALISPIREQRKNIETNLSQVEQILLDGVEAVRVEARMTMTAVKNAMKIDYFK